MRVDLVLADHGGGGVLDDHEAGVDARLRGEEGGQAVAERGVDHALGAALGRVGDLAGGDAEEIGQGAMGSPWKLPPEITASSSRNISGLSVTALSLDLDLHGRTRARQRQAPMQLGMQRRA